MIFGEGGFVRTLWYGRSRIWQKARKYRRFGGFKRNRLWLCAVNLSVQGFFGFNTAEFLLGEGSFLLRLFYALCGVAANFLVLFVIIYKPFKTLAK